MPVLICRRVRFFSVGDELSFSSWLKRVKAIRRWEGKDDCILLHVTTRVSDKSLREFIALFLRYDIDLTLLSQFMSSQNEVWFGNPDMIWHQRVFCAGRKGSVR